MSPLGESHAPTQRGASHTGTQPTGAGFTAGSHHLRSPDRNPLCSPSPWGGHLQGWGLHSPSRGPLCPHTARAAPGIGRGEGRFPSSPASLGEHHGSSLGGTWVVGRGPWDHGGGEVRGDGGMGARRPGGRAPPRPPGASTLTRGHTPALRPLTTF